MGHHRPPRCGGLAESDIYLEGRHDRPAVIYETADPGKFPETWKKRSASPRASSRNEKTAGLTERICRVESDPDRTAQGLTLADDQVREAKQRIAEIFRA